MSQLTLLSLDDALLDSVAHFLVGYSGCKDAVRTLCLVCRRLAQLVKQPLAAWADCDVCCCVG